MQDILNASPAGVLAAVLLLVLAGSALRTAGMLGIFEKAGYKAYQAFIPVYGAYCFFRIIRCVWLFFVQIAVSLLYVLLVDAPWLWLSAKGNAAHEYALYQNIFLALFLTIAYLSSDRLARAFGKGWGYTFGLMFLNPVFLAMLGCKKDTVYATGVYDIKFLDSLRWECPACHTMNAYRTARCEKCGAEKGETS